MKEYESRDEAANDPDLDLRIIWKCDKCGQERTDRVGYNEGGKCYCGGMFYEAGELYKG